jgi:prepilin-type N-terminal cleavage/methylation domain-containing protein
LSFQGKKAPKQSLKLANWRINLLVNWRIGLLVNRLIKKILINFFTSCLFILKYGNNIYIYIERERKSMTNKKGFTLIELLVVISIIGVLALMGLRVYGDQQEKAKNAMVKANAGTVQTLIQAELADTDVNLEGAVDIAKAAGLHNPFNNTSMNEAGYFPEVADAPGKIQITFSEPDGVFSIQGYGANGLLPDILTARR